MQLGSLEIQMMADIARLRKDMDDAKTAVGGAMADITRAVDFAKGALVAFTGIASINAFKGMIEGSLHGVAALRELSIQTGASVESMSALVAVGKLTGTSGDDIASMMNKLAKNMSVANEESKGTAQAIKALGLDFNEFNALSPDDKIMALAEAMNEFGDGSDKSAAAMTLLGKSGAAALPYLKELAEVGSLQAKVTEEQAAQARQFEVDQKRLTASGQAWKKELALGMLPAIQETMSAVLGLVNGTGGLRAQVKKLSEDGSIVEWTRGAVTAVTYLMDAFSYVKDLAQSIGVVVGATIDFLVNAFGTLASVIVKVIKGDYRGAIDDVTTSNARAKLQFAALKDTLVDTWGGDTLGQQLRDRIKDIQAVGVAGEGVKEKLNFKAAGDTKATGASEASAFDTIAASISKELAMATQLLAMGRALTESEKFQVTTLEALDKAMQQGKISGEQDVELKRRMAEAVTKAAEAESFLAAQKARATNNAAADKALETTQKEIDALIANNEQLRLNNEIIGLTTQEVDKLTLARLDAGIALKELNLIGLKNIEGTEMQVLMMEREIGLLKQKRDLTATGQSRTAEAKAIQANFEEWKKGWEETDRFARETFMAWAEDGSTAAQKIGDTLKKALLSAIYEATLKPIAFQIYSQATGAMGMASAAGAGSSALSGGGMLAGGWNALSSGYGAGSAIGMDAFGAGASMVGSATGVNSALAGIGQMVGAIPVFGQIALGMTALAAIFGGGGFKSSATTGETVVGLDALGALTYGAGPKGRTGGSDSGAAGLAKTYAATAAALGIKGGNAEFFYGGNTGAQGENPNFALSGGIVGRGGYAIGETGLNDTALQLAASRAIFATLQKSDLPEYLGHAFDGMVAADMSKADIDAAIANAQKLKAAYDANLAAQAAWQDKIDVLTGKTTQRSLDLKAALVGTDEPTARLIQSFYDLQDAQTAAKTAADALAKADAAALATLKERTAWQDRLDVLLGKTTQREQALRNDLASTTDAATKALIAQVYAQEDLTQAATDAATAAETIKNGWKSISDSLIAEINRIRGVMGGTGADGFANAQAAFATATAQARAGDQDAAKLLPQLSANLLTLAEANSKTLLDLRQYQGQTAASLSTTAGIVAGLTARQATSTGGGSAVTVGGGSGGAASSGGGFFNAYQLQGGAIYKDYITNPDEIAKLTDIAAFVNSTFDGSAASLQAIKAHGGTQAQIAAALGYKQADIAAVFANAGIPAFAVGTNFVPRDMVAQIHEGEAIVPRAYNPAAGGSGNNDLVAAVNSLRNELAAQRADGNQTAVATKKTYELLRNISRDGVAMVTTT